MSGIILGGFKNYQYFTKLSLNMSSEGPSSSPTPPPVNLRLDTDQILKRFSGRPAVAGDVFEVRDRIAGRADRTLMRPPAEISDDVFPEFDLTRDPDEEAPLEASTEVPAATTIPAEEEDIDEICSEDRLTDPLELAPQTDPDGVQSQQAVAMEGDWDEDATIIDEDLLVRVGEAEEVRAAEAKRVADEEAKRYTDGEK